MKKQKKYSEPVVATTNRVLKLIKEGRYYIEGPHEHDKCIACKLALREIYQYVRELSGDEICELMELFFQESGEFDDPRFALHLIIDMQLWKLSTKPNRKLLRVRRYERYQGGITYYLMHSI